MELRLWSNLKKLVFRQKTKIIDLKLTCLIIKDFFLFLVEWSNFIKFFCPNKIMQSFVAEIFESLQKCSTICDLECTEAELRIENEHTLEFNQTLACWKSNLFHANSKWDTNTPKVSIGSQTIKLVSKYSKSNLEIHISFQGLFD